ncbi:hypothetical protein [Paraliomyxa miuraensis]|uniref:hypothetical protein n=1 Tax=Paraliomyxa miuraensis TaxID=376150 RepID=UPI0022504E54|nr:hypothetical protein [Paraliomyxa miuraensis]MCX4239959.1 hypothetical protein [Paraliomyxa miuraensis]
MSPALRITHATLDDDGRKLRLELTVANPAERTLHLYRTMRAVRYDASTRTLQVQLSERGLEEPTRVGSFLWPRFTSVDPGGTASLGVTVPRVLSRMRPEQANGRTPIIEALPAHEAVVVEVEVAWSGTPFYDDPRPRAGGPRARLVAWPQGLACVRFTRDGSTGEPDRPTEPELGPRGPITSPPDPR